MSVFYSLTGTDVHPDPHCDRPLMCWTQEAGKASFYSGKLGVPWPSPALHLAPANARILVSRNKREGRYVGWCSEPAPKHYVGYPFGHQREGHQDNRPLPLRARRWV